MNNPSYLIGQGRQFLKELRVYENGRREKIMTVYKYEAARVPKLQYACHIARALRQEGPWDIYRFDSLHGDIFPVTKGE